MGSTYSYAATPRGERRVFAVPGTPSDCVENTRHDLLRRILRDDGMLETVSQTPPPRQPSRIELLERRLAEIERRLGMEGD